MADIAGAPSGNVSPEQYDAYIATITKAMAASSGFARTQLQAQINDAKKARQNAMAIAQVQAEVQRFGITTSRQNLLDQLQENARQFDQNHGLELEKLGLSREQLAENARQFNVTSGNQASQFGQTFGEGQRQFGLTFGEGQRRFDVTTGEGRREFDITAAQNRQRLGLDYAKTATDYMSTPDRYFQAADYTNMGRQALAGQGPAPYAASGSPVAKTTDDFAVLAGYRMPGEGDPQAYAGGTSSFNEAPGGGGANRSTDQGTDPRLKAVRGVFEAIPPSNEYGLNDNDFAALQAAKAIYSSKGLKPGTLERMRPGQLAMNRSAGARLGNYVPDWEADYRAYGVGQGSVRAA
jgi:hypothetical protein